MLNKAMHNLVVKQCTDYYNLYKELKWIKDNKKKTTTE